MSDDPTKDEIPALRPADRGGRWARLAERLGLRHLTRRGPLGLRTPVLVGERDGYLVAVAPSHSINASSVDVLVRFPQGHTVRGFADDLKKDLRRRRRRHVTVGDGAVVQRLPYAVFPPRAASVARATDDVVAAMRERVRALDRTCEYCHRPEGLGVYVWDGAPLLACEPCMTGFLRGEREALESVEALPPDSRGGVATGAAAAGALGIALGAIASLAVVYGGAHVLYAAAPVYVALGYLVSAFASRGFVASSPTATLLKLPLALLSVPVATTVMTAVARMTLDPAEWNLRFLLTSFVGPFLGTPKVVFALAAATAAGWLVEAALRAVGGTRRRARKWRLERVDA